MLDGRSNRKWNDAELTEAVSSQRSWRGSARALGLKGTSAGVIRTIKRHAKRLNLDTSHFTSQRTWSDRDLREAVAAADTWSDVIRSLELADNSRTRVKGHAVRLGLDIAHLQPRPLDVTVIDFQGMTPTQSMLRTAAEPIAIAWFCLRGIPVAVPSQRSAYDLMVTLPSGVQRVQVKSSTFRGPHGTWKVDIGQRPYALDKSASKAPYDPDSVDYFFIIDGAANLYLIPSRMVAGRRAINVGAYGNCRIGSASSLFDKCT